MYGYLHFPILGVLGGLSVWVIIHVGPKSMGRVLYVVRR